MSAGLMLSTRFGWDSEAAHVAVGMATGVVLAAVTSLRLVRLLPSATMPPAADASARGPGGVGSAQCVLVGQRRVDGRRGMRVPSHPMTPQAFVDKWRDMALKERSASQSHFNDLCTRSHAR